MSKERLIINDSEVRLTKDSKIAITYQVNDLADVKDRQASFTNQFSCEDCDENRATFGHCNHPASLTRLPYKANSAKIVADGIEVVRNGIAYISGTSGKFNVVVYDGLKKFFETMGDKTLNDLVFDYFPVWSFDDIAAEFGDFSNDHVYIVVNDGLNYSALNRFMNAETMFPAIKFSSIMREIFRQAGYSYESESFTDDRFAKAVMPFTNENVVFNLDVDIDRKGMKTFRSVIDDPFFNLPLYPSISAPANFKFDDTSVNGWDKTHGDYNSTLGAYISTLNKTGIFYFRGYIELVPDSGTGQIFNNIVIRCRLVKNGVPIYFETKYFIASADNTITVGAKKYFKFDIQQEVAMTSGDVIRFNFVGGNQYPVLGAINDFNIVNENPETGEANYAMTGVFIKDFNQFGGYWDIAKNLPNMKQKDFVKAVANIFAHVIDVDNVKKHVTFVPFNRITKNKSIADDWSEYMKQEAIDVETVFHPSDYARTNFVKWKKDENVTDGFGDDSFDIDDASISATKTVIELPFAASDNSDAFLGARIANVKRYKDNDPDKAIKPQPRMLILKKTTFSNVASFPVVLKYYPESIAAGFTFAVFAYFTDEEDIDHVRDLNFKYILRDNYSGLLPVFDAYRKIRPKMLIPSRIFSNPRGYIPKYIAKFGAYFYLNKIENWRNNELCIVELIKL